MLSLLVTHRIRTSEEIEAIKYAEVVTVGEVREVSGIPPPVLVTSDCAFIKIRYYLYNVRYEEVRVRGVPLREYS